MTFARVLASGLFMASAGWFYAHGDNESLAGVLALVAILLALRD